MGLQCGRQCTLQPLCIARVKGSDDIRIVTKQAKLDYYDQLYSSSKSKLDALYTIRLERIESLIHLTDDNSFTAIEWCDFLDDTFRKCGVLRKEVKDSFHQALRIRRRERKRKRQPSPDKGGTSYDDDSYPQFEDAWDTSVSFAEFKEIFPDLLRFLIRAQTEQMKAIEAKKVPLQDEIEQISIMGTDIFRKMDTTNKGYITRSDVRLCGGGDDENQQFFMDIFDQLDDIGIGRVSRMKFEQNLTVNTMLSILNRITAGKADRQRYRYLFTVDL